MDNNDKKGPDIQPSDDSRMSFGAALKKARLEKGMSIEDIMDYTRISKFMVQQIEDANLAKLPEPVYLKGFLKTYAQAVGLDPEDIVQRYNRAQNRENAGSDNSRENARVRRVSYREVKPPKDEDEKGSLKWIAVLIVIAALFEGGYYYYKHMRNTGATIEAPVPPVEAPQDTGSKADKPEAAAPAPVPPPPAAETAETQPAVTPDGYHLEVICTEKTSLKVSVDGGSPDEYLLKPSEHLDLKAVSTFNILVDNKCGVTLFLNSKQVTLPGKCGQTVNIQLP
jgi:cytoskeletal protein RodZ